MKMGFCKLQIENCKMKNGKKNARAARQHGGAFAAASKVRNAGYARMHSGHTPGPTPICNFKFAIFNLQKSLSPIFPAGAS
jgi:hypothetical protein